MLPVCHVARWVSHAHASKTSKLWIACDVKYRQTTSVRLKAAMICAFRLQNSKQKFRSCGLVSGFCRRPFDSEYRHRKASWPGQKEKGVKRGGGSNGIEVCFVVSSLSVEGSWLMYPAV